MPEERRIVTVLFADVAGSTALGEQLDPEDVRALLSRYYDLARDVVSRHGGTLEKFIGDAVMAVFGLPVAHGDDAALAIAAGLSLRDAIAGDPGLARIQLRIGVNTGEVVATQDASRGEFLVTGDAVNVAARIQQNAEPGQVLAGETTHRAAPVFSYGEPLSIVTKGKAAHLRAWPVVARAERVTARTPFLGRRSDLEQLHLVARRAFGERRPYLVTITAPAGTGKSRLVQELLLELHAARNDLRVATAQCLPYGQTLTYWPLRAILADLVGPQRTATFGSTRDEIARWLGEDGSRDAALIASTVWPERGEQEDRERIFAAWRRLIELLAAPGPLVVLFEDLHWAADSLLDLVEHVMQPRTRAPLLILSVARPELLDRRSGWGGGQRNYVNLALDPLSDGEIGQLVAHLLEAEPPDTLQRLIVDRAEGNPFFAGELVRTLLDRGVSRLSDPETLRSTLAELPATVHATVLARLDLLGERDRAIAQAASIVGRSFDLEAVRVISGIDAAGVDASIDALLAKDFVVPSDGTFTFRHILIRDVAYQTLSRSRRARDHSRLARYLAERADSERIADLVALHFLEASRLRRGLVAARDDAVAEEDRRNAIEWISRAAAANARIGAVAEADRQLRDGIALATPEEELPLQEQLGTALTYGDVSLLACRRAYELAQLLGKDPLTTARVLARYLVIVERWQGSVSPENRPDDATVHRLNDEVLELARRSGDEHVIGMAHTVRSFYPFRSADLRPEVIEGARRDAQEAVAIFERLDDVSWLSAALDGLGSCEQASDDARAYYAVKKRRIQILDRLTDVGERVDTAVTFAWSCVPLGKVPEGLALARRGVADVPPGRFLNFRLHALAWLATLSAMAGEWDETVAAGRDAVGTWREMGRPFTAYRRRGMAVALFVAKRRHELDLAADIAQSLSEEVAPAGISTGVVSSALVQAVVRDDPTLALEVLERPGRAPVGMDAAERSLALLAATRTPPNVGIERLDELVAWAERREVTPIVAHLLRLRSIALGGDAAALRRAVALLDSCAMVPDRALAQLELALVERDPTILAAARRDLERIRDEVGLERAADVAAAIA